MLLAACGDDDGGGGTPDARVGGFVDASVPVDAMQCPTGSFLPGAQITAGGSDNFFGVGAGAWVGVGASSGPPGQILYIEAYADLLGGTSVDVTAFENWIEECSACVFYGTGCATYTIELESGEPTAGPAHCEKLYMLERGTVSFTSLDTTAASGSLTGTVMPLTGDSNVRLVEVFRTGEADTPTGYGQRDPNGACLDVPSLSFDGTWGGATGDAGVSDGGVTTDAGVSDAGSSDAGATDAASGTDAQAADANTST